MLYCLGETGVRSVASPYTHGQGTGEPLSLVSPHAPPKRDGVAGLG